MPSIRDFSEIRFEWLMEQRGFPFWTEDKLEEVLEVKGKRPDFAFQAAAGVLILAEIKSFTPSARQLPRGRIGAVSMEALMTAPKLAVRHAAKQLRPYKDLRIPLVVVLDNWRQLGVVLDWPVLIQLLGEATVRMLVERDTGTAKDVHWAPGGGQVLHPEQKTYVSAVLVNLRTSPAYTEKNRDRECQMRVRVLYNPFAAVELPTDVFSHPLDEHVAYDPNKRCWINPITGARYK